MTLYGNLISKFESMTELVSAFLDYARSKLVHNNYQVFFILTSIVVQDLDKRHVQHRNISYTNLLLAPTQRANKINHKMVRHGLLIDFDGAKRAASSEPLPRSPGGHTASLFL